MSKEDTKNTESKVKIFKQTSSGGSGDNVTRADYEKGLSDITERFEERIADRETKTTEVLAIFITLFTFISVNVSIFTRVSDIQSAVWFMLLITLCCLVLLGALFYLISKNMNWKSIVLLIVVFIALVVLLVATRFYPNWNIKIIDPINATIPK